MRVIARKIGVADCGMIPVVPPKKKRFETWESDKNYKQRNEADDFSKIEAFSTRCYAIHKLDQTYLAMIHLVLIYGS